MIHFISRSFAAHLSPAEIWFWCQDSPDTEDGRRVVDGAVDLRVEHGGVAVVLGRVGHAGVPHHSVQEVSRESHP